MNYPFNNTNKPFIALLLIHSIATTNSLQAMDTYPHDTVIIKNENHDNLSTLQINYSEVEMRPSQQIDRLGHKIAYLKPNVIGVNTVLNAATETKCRIAKDGETSLLEIRHKNANIYDQYAYVTIYGIYQKLESLQLKTRNNDIITIEAKDKDNRIIIKQNQDIVGYIISK